MCEELNAQLKRQYHHYHHPDVEERSLPILCVRAFFICVVYVLCVDNLDVTSQPNVSALVLSRLDYCNAVLAGLPASTMAPLQRVLHAAAKVVLHLKPRDHRPRDSCSA